jgi:hypothetical protein
VANTEFKVYLLPRSLDSFSHSLGQVFLLSSFSLERFQRGAQKSQIWVSIERMFEVPKLTTFTDYQGAREAPALVEFAKDRLPNFSKRITSKATDKKAMNIEEFLNLKVHCTFTLHGGPTSRPPRKMN